MTNGGTDFRRLVAAVSALLCLGALISGLSDVSTAATPTPRSTSAASAPASQARADGDEVDVTIRRTNSTYIEKREPIVVHATATNRSDHVWKNVKAYLVISPGPMTDADSVAATADGPADTYINERIFRPFRLISDVGRLGVGKSKRFRVRVPYKFLGLGSNPQEGVYQVAVEITGTDEEGLRDDNAIGRARTLMPYLNERTASDDPIEISMVWPFTTTIRRAPDGSYPDADDLIASVSRNGQLGRMLASARDAPARTITVLLDPALIEALSAIAQGTYGPPEADSQPSTLEPDDLPSGSLSPQQTAKNFLSGLRDLAQAQDVWMSPYAQPDLDALAQHPHAKQAAEVYQATENTSRNVLKRFGLDGRVAYTPPDGIAELDSLQWAQSNTDTSDPSRPGPAAILSPEMLNDWDDSGSPLISLDAGDSTIPTVVDDGAVMSGGPAPGRTDRAFQIRQRLASAATVRAIERTIDPDTSEDLAVVVGSDWDPGPRSNRIDIFDALDATWVKGVSPERELDQHAANWQGPVGVPSDESTEPVTDTLVDAAAQIVRDADDLASLVDAGESLRDYYGASAGMVVSQNWRADMPEADTYASEAVDGPESQLDKITIDGPGYVSLSGNSGRLPITIHNGLDVPIKVGVAIRAKGERLEIPDMEPKEVAAGQSPSFTIDADIGEVTNTAFMARLVTPNGRRFGEPAEFSVRSSVVGTAIWIGMGIAVVLVVIALARRIRRRRESPPADEAAP
ncbi:DUF6049 family protein [Solicola gregarius]|uniref:DUF6049 family protein n=1 Tax=Solicola gregarius TaxID=2908642 RepID=A0AA46TLX7_9ACTN|nr:DUF6049 family protein [Solicola gregarius]UYM07352.1 DUF6049 family protein [Solicola gregarius]